MIVSSSICTRTANFLPPPPLPFTLIPAELPRWCGVVDPSTPDGVLSECFILEPVFVLLPAPPPTESIDILCNFNLHSSQGESLWPISSCATHYTIGDNNNYKNNDSLLYIIWHLQDNTGSHHTDSLATSSHECSSLDGEHSHPQTISLVTLRRTPSFNYSWPTKTTTTCTSSAPAIPVINGYWDCG